MNALTALRLPEGIHKGVPERDYHGDPGETPTASSGVLRLLSDRSPKHAQIAHPRLNPNYQEKAGTEAQDRGTILHALTLGTTAPFRVLDVTDYRTSAAKTLRDETISAGLIPVKVSAMVELQDIAASVRARLQAIPEAWSAMQDALHSQMTEVSLIWREKGVLCRCRYDTLPDARFKATYDPKFTGLSAEPNAFGKKVTGDYSFQAELYPRAVKVLRGDSPLFVFVAIETEAPFGVTLHALDPEAAELAREKLDAALDAWAHCLKTGIWPSYSSLIHYHGARPWQFTDWEDRVALSKQAKQYANKTPQSAIDNYNAMMLETGARA